MDIDERDSKILKLLIKPLTLSIAMIFLSSCAVKAKQIRPHSKSFALVKTIVEVKIYSCENKEKKENKCEFKSLGKKAALGSGTFFHYRSSRAFLTAGHVCLGPAYEIWNKLPAGSRVIPEIHLESFSGHHIKGKISYVNLKYDLCVVEAKHPTIKRLPRISQFNSRMHKEYYSIAAPASIFHTGMVPVLKGLYVGDSSIFSFYTMPAAPGASGGAIYDRKDEIVGIVQRTHSAFTHITLSIKHKDLKQILDRYIELKKQGVDSIIE